MLISCYSVPTNPRRKIQQQKEMQQTNMKFNRVIAIKVTGLFRAPQNQHIKVQYLTLIKVQQIINIIPELLIEAIFQVEMQIRTNIALISVQNQNLSKRKEISNMYHKDTNLNNCSKSNYKTQCYIKLNITTSINYQVTISSYLYQFFTNVLLWPRVCVKQKVEYNI